ncbi:MAG: glutamate synthase large subunit, partial [Hyphomicrobiaceae bacterium]|nr:glutamate synthase large subunit [Hyphomicrobiaceae bacterium]
MSTSARASKNTQHHSNFSQGLYDTRNEHDSCGVGFIADLSANKTHKIVEDGLKILSSLIHRGAVGADPQSGDGAGILVQIPDEFLRSVTEFSLPDIGDYAVGHVFMPRGKRLQKEYKSHFERVCEQEGLVLIGWREVPTDNSVLSSTTTATEPEHFQVFVGKGSSTLDGAHFERKLYVLRKIVTNAIKGKKAGSSRGQKGRSFYIVSLSTRTIVYKGMFLSGQLGYYYPDLNDARFKSAIALVHQRFSTNTFPSWELAHPFRMVAHNGEINTARSNFNWMRAREGSITSRLFCDDLGKILPISFEGQSDTACFDNALEFLTLGGYSIAHAASILIPEAWENNPSIKSDRRAFYEFHSALMEPWDGPAAVVFTDGRQIGATLDRNGLRPARYFRTKQGLVVMASEAGVLPIPDEDIVEKWRLQPGRMLLVDLDEGRIISDDELKGNLAVKYPYKAWVNKAHIKVESLPKASKKLRQIHHVSILELQRAFGYTQESIKIFIDPMARTGHESISSMGTDTPVSVLSDKNKLLHTYFKQNFAQATNPPIDPIREKLVMSLVSFIGPRPNIFDLTETAELPRLKISQPILTDDELERIRHISSISDDYLKAFTLDITYAVEAGANWMETALEFICDQAERAVAGKYNIIILSDRLIGPARISVPSLLATSAVHHHLIKKGLRTAAGLVVETGEAHEIHQFCTLAGYGAEAINPYLAFASIKNFFCDVSEDVINRRYINAINESMLKVMSKMGISTYQSYCGAQIFDAIGLNEDFIASYFRGTRSQIGGIGLAEIAAETVERHRNAFSGPTYLSQALDVGGDYAVRVSGERHAWTASTVANLQHAVRANVPEKYREFASQINKQSECLTTLRGMFRIRSARELGYNAVHLEDVEPASEIVKRFVTGAMSLGSISHEAHTTLALAMNRIGGKSNTGEGGEDPVRFKSMNNGDSTRSAVKQVASGRFGVTAEYLVNSDMMQIKLAQGAKPGEGGQLPGQKVNETIARLRHSTPGVGLISPPPHHDIYSIEDVAQLIYDLKNVNPDGEVSVKLVSEVGVGTIAAGVAKCKADHITISGFE